MESSSLLFRLGTRKNLSTEKEASKLRQYIAILKLQLTSLLVEKGCEADRRPYFWLLLLHVYNYHTLTPLLSLFC